MFPYTNYLNLEEIQMTDENYIDPILKRYYTAFKEKTYSAENNDTDVLMDIFGITPEQKRKNRQYWGRELGMMWQLIVTEICRAHCTNFHPALKIGNDEPCDLIIGNDAIDTKYRIGSGDSGTLKKFKQYGNLLKERDYNPILLILREDNLPAAITACNHGGWTVLTGTRAFDYLFRNTGVDVYNLLKYKKGTYPLF